jgi:hypothetical protein
MKIDCTTVDSSVAAGDFFAIRQMVEAQNCTQLAYGNAAAKSVTISFNVSSPKSGTHTLVLGNADSSRSYAAEYTVAVADTAERISVTIPGDTAGTVFAADTGEGLRLIAHEDYGTTLARCQRYFWRQSQQASASTYIGSGFNQSTTISQIFVPFPVQMRAVRHRQTQEQYPT